MLSSYDDGIRISLKRFFTKDNIADCIVIMNIPSTANSVKDDETTLRLSKILRKNGYSGYVLLNINVKNIYDYIDINKCDNDIIIAWGSSGKIKGNTFVKNTKVKLKCFGINKDKSPKMPTRLSYNTKVIDYII